VKTLSMRFFWRELMSTSAWVAPLLSFPVLFLTATSRVEWFMICLAVVVGYATGGTVLSSLIREHSPASFALTRPLSRDQFFVRRYLAQILLLVAWVGVCTLLGFALEHAPLFGASLENLDASSARVFENAGYQLSFSGSEMESSRGGSNDGFVRVHGVISPLIVGAALSLVIGCITACTCSRR
jgi:hypothetical protein